MKTIKNLEKFKDLTYEKFRQMACDDSLSQYEKIGFPDSYRAGFAEKIFSDIQNKLSNIQQRNKTIIDIGPGCSDLVFMLINLCRSNGHSLILVDSKEVLSHIPNESFIKKIPGRYPEECQDFFQEFTSKMDIVLCYSVFHYIFTEGNIYNFLDKSLSLLSPGGQMLIGDIPNVSMRKRFFVSENGIKYHQQFTGKKEIPEIKFNCLEAENIDDAVLLSLMMRCRNSGYDAYLLPQDDVLPMANRREDLLIKRP